MDVSPVSLAARPLHAFEPQVLAPLHEVNERLLEFLASVARLDAHRCPYALVGPLRPLLMGSRSVRRRAARQPILLAEMEFRDQEWWEAVTKDPDRLRKHRVWTAGAPKRSAIQLTRATLLLARHSAHIDPTLSHAMFGMLPSIARILASLTLDQIDRIADHQYRHLRPRWEDRPWLWRELLTAAQTEDENALRNFTLHALQLLVGDNVPSSV